MPGVAEKREAGGLANLLLAVWQARKPLKNGPFVGPVHKSSQILQIFYVFLLHVLLDFRHSRMVMPYEFLKRALRCDGDEKPDFAEISPIDNPVLRS